MIKTFEQALHEKELRIIQNNAETVTLTLRSYEDLKSQIKQQNENYDRLIELTHDIVENNGNFQLEKEYSKFAFGTSYFAMKTGVNEEIDQLKKQNQKLIDEINIKRSFIEKLKNLFS